MFRKYYPTARAKSVYDIDYEMLQNLGYEAIIFDIDSTLVPHGSPVTLQNIQLFQQLHQLGLKTLLLSNNSDERVSEFSKPLDTLYVALADKPQSSGFLKALDLLETDKRKAIMIGDQLFTDVKGANAVGLSTILVPFLVHEGEVRMSKRRFVERLILFTYRLGRKNHTLDTVIKGR